MHNIWKTLSDPDYYGSLKDYQTVITDDLDSVRLKYYYKYVYNNEFKIQAFGEKSNFRTTDETNYKVVQKVSIICGSYRLPEVQDCTKPSSKAIEPQDYIEHQEVVIFDSDIEDDEDMDELPVESNDRLLLNGTNFRADLPVSRDLTRRCKTIYSSYYLR